MNPNPQPGAGDRDGVERLIRDAQARAESAPIAPLVTERPSGIVIQVSNIGPDYAAAHVVVCDPFCCACGCAFMQVVESWEVPGMVASYLRAAGWVRRN